MTASPTFSAPLGSLMEAWREMTASARPDPALPGHRLASVPVAFDVPVVLSWMGDTKVTVQGTLSLHRLANGRHLLGVEMPHPTFGGFHQPVRRQTLSLDDVLDVRWEPGRWGGALVVTPMGRSGLGAFPSGLRGPVTLRVGRGGRGEAVAFAHAVALADLPD